MLSKLQSFCLKSVRQPFFSVTMPKEIVALAKCLLNDQVKIEVVPQGTTAAEIIQKLYCVSTSEKRMF